MEGGDGDGDGDGEPPRCEALGEPPNNATKLNPEDDLADALGKAAPNRVFVLSSGLYVVEGALVIDTGGVTVRSESGDPSDVIIAASGGVSVGADEVTLAELTIEGAAGGNNVTVAGADDFTMYRVVSRNAAAAALLVTDSDGDWSDRGTVECSRAVLEPVVREALDDAGACDSNVRGIALEGGRDWTIRDNRVEGFFCPRAPAGAGIGVDRGARDVVVDRNRLVDCAVGISAGRGEPTAQDRTWDDAPCTEAASVYAANVTNNMVATADSALGSSDDGAIRDLGVESSCQVHNSMASALDAEGPSIAVRYVGEGTTLVNNLVTGSVERIDGAEADELGTVEADSGFFVDVASANLHLTDAAEAARGTGDPSGVDFSPTDFDLDVRSVPVDVGADEVE